MATLTSRTLASGASLNDLIHIVITGDTSQSANGSSYKATLSQLVPLFSGSTNTVVTGGTYDNSIGTATFTNNIGGTFDVTGFTTGSTEVFLTGGTVNSTGGTATFTNTTGGTFTITGMTTPFSGGSGNCINDLYTDNIHACNDEITVHHRVQSVGSDAQATLSFAFGNNTSATANYSWAIGETTTAIGIASFAQGSGTIASGQTSHAEGDSTFAGGIASHAEGTNSIASGNYSHAEGSSTASGIFSHAEGDGSIASGQYSHAENKGSIASGNNSHAGGNSEARGALSFTHGDGNLAAGGYSVAFGSGSTASGQTSIVLGEFNYTEGPRTVVFGGNNNLIGTGDTDSSVIIGGRNHQMNSSTPSDPLYDSAILGGNGNSITTHSSAIISSVDSILSSNQSVILGGAQITGTSADTAYVPKIVLYPTYSYTPTGTTDNTVGEVGSVTWDDTYLYYRDNTGWKRISGATW
jgi:hypothetical protein